jgi:hypothetical protein
VDYAREDLRDQVIALLNASRDLSPAEDEALAETFVSRIGTLPARRRRVHRVTPMVYASLSALVILLAIPVVMVIQSYSALDGYLPRVDAGALPLIYWLTLAGAILLLIGAVISERTGWRLQIKIAPVRQGSR